MMLSKLLTVFFDPVIWGGAIAIAIVVTLIETKRLVDKEFAVFNRLGWLNLALAFSAHELTHQGGSKGYYFNLDYLTTSPEEVKRLIKWYVDEIKKFTRNSQIDGLAFIEKDSGPIGAISIIGSIVAETNIPAIIVRLRKRISHARITGNPDMVERIQTGAKVAVITDMFTTKRTIKDAIDVIEGSGAKVMVVYGILDRQGEVLDLGRNIPIVSYATEDDLVDGNLVAQQATEEII